MMHVNHGAVSTILRLYLRVLYQAVVFWTEYLSLLYGYWITGTTERLQHELEQISSFLKSSDMDFAQNRATY